MSKIYLVSIINDLPEIEDEKAFQSYEAAVQGVKSALGEWLIQGGTSALGEWLIFCRKNSISPEITLSVGSMQVDDIPSEEVFNEHGEQFTICMNCFVLVLRTVNIE